MTSASLPQLASLARAGAVSRAWDLFEAQGYAALTGDVAALAVKGRILKARARQAGRGDRQPLFAEAAAVYRAANRLAPAPYLAINAATLALLGGDAARARNEAAAVLPTLGEAADTPYFLAATRAEALLLLGDAAGAQAAMEEAARADRDGWADRAATVAQLREIAAATGDDAAWIDAFAAPASLHFAGHMGIAAGGQSEAALRAAFEAHLAAHPVGFAWGALAAGSDIVVAEVLREAGAALHVVLPCPPEQFEAQSVAPAGAGWTRRYRALLAAAASLRIAAESATSVHDPLATAFAGDLAIGGALLNAAQLASRAEQLIVLDERGGGANTAHQAERWHTASGPQYWLTAPRDAAVEALFPPEAPDPARRLAVHLAIVSDDLVQGPQQGSAALQTLAAELSASCTDLPPGSLRPAPGGWDAVVEDIATAAGAARRIAAGGRFAVGAHLAIGPVIADPASGVLLPLGPAPALARRLAALAQPGTALASDALAVTLCARSPQGCRSELYYPWEDDLGGAVHVLA